MDDDKRAQEIHLSEQESVTNRSSDQDSANGAVSVSSGR